MNRIASSLLAAALLLSATPAFAQQDGDSLQREAQLLSEEIETTDRGAHGLRVRLNAAWANARTARAERSELSRSAEAGSEAGQARIAELDVEVGLRAVEIRRLRVARAQVVAQRRQLRGERDAIQLALSQLERRDLSTLAAR